MSQSHDFDPKNIQMEKVIGKGTFGKVISGHLKSNNLEIAIKRIDKKTISEYGDYLKEALEKELENMQKCSCANSVQFYFRFDTLNNHNIVMELCDNDLINELNKRPKGFNVDEVRYIMSQLNNTFKIMAKNNILHRDLKLGNILVKYTDETKTKFIPKLCDYGFSKELLDKDFVTTTHLGTPATMAPEIMKGEEYNAKADVWSIGVLIYQLHFKKIPYQGVTEQDIYEKIKNKIPYTKPKDPELRDLINHLLVEDPKKRFSWDEYFAHPFFTNHKEEEYINNIFKVDKTKIGKDNNTNEKSNYFGLGDKYIYESDFDIGYKNEMFKCWIAHDLKNNKKVIIKSYLRKFVLSNKFLFEMEYKLITTLKNNDCCLKLIHVEREKDFHLIFDFVEGEILPIYMTHYQYDEDKLQILNKELLDKLFNYCELFSKPFIFISLYSFVITKEGKPLLFDFGINKCFLPKEEVSQYYIIDPKENVDFQFAIKTNVMNYGITLLKCFYGNNFELKIINDEIILPDDKTISDDFKKFLSKCLKKNIINRRSWLELKKEEYFQNMQINIEDNIVEEEKTLIDDKIFKGIIRSLDNKYDLINKYFDSLEINAKTPNIKEMEYFLILTLIEQLSLLNILKTEEYNYSDIRKEITFLTLDRCKTKEFRINLGNPIFNKMKIFNNNDIVIKFISQLKKYISKLKKILLKYNKITKSTFFEGNYQNFLKEFSKILVDINYNDYFALLIKQANEDWLKKKYEKARIKAPIAEYLTESVLFIKNSIINYEKETLYFHKEDLIKNFIAVFENEDEDNVEVSCVKLVKEKEKYILISFLSQFLKSLINVSYLGEKERAGNKRALDLILNLYNKLVELLVYNK